MSHFADERMKAQGEQLVTAVTSLSFFNPTHLTAGGVLRKIWYHKNSFKWSSLRVALLQLLEEADIEATMKEINRGLVDAASVAFDDLIEQLVDTMFDEDIRSVFYWWGVREAESAKSREESADEKETSLEGGQAEIRPHGHGEVPETLVSEGGRLLQRLKLVRDAEFWKLGVWKSENLETLMKDSDKLIKSLTSFTEAKTFSAIDKDDLQLLKDDVLFQTRCLLAFSSRLEERVRSRRDRPNDELFNREKTIIHDAIKDAKNKLRHFADSFEAAKQQSGQ